MREDTTISFMNPAFRDELSELVREGARQIIRQAVEAELGAFLEEHAADRDARVVGVRLSATATCLRGRC